jgi:4-amino-4-deoxy-L-arabinose transferase-like glycosyltransferase
MSVTIDRPTAPPMPTWELAAASVLPAATRQRTIGWLQHMPLAAVLLVQAVLSLRLQNTAFDDEALYIAAGHDYIAHFLHGTPVIDYGTFFSGAPAVYPVLAAALDTVGGLALVRLFSLLCMLAVTMCTYSVTRHLFGPRAAILAAAAFAFTGPVAFLGNFATFDGLCVASLAAATWLGVSQRSYLSCLGIGTALAVAVTVKYTGAAFTVPVLALTFLTTRQLGRRVTRTAIAASWTAALLGTGYYLWGASIQPGIDFTTANRTALSPAPISQLLGYLAQDIGALLLLAGVGTVVAARSLRSSLLVLTLLGAAALIPAGQLHLHEAVSFEKHTAYSALFLAPLAGLGLALLSQRSLKLLLAFAAVWVLLIIGLDRSHTMYQWPNVSQVVQLINQDPTPGRYISTSSRSLAYYTRQDHPDIHWDDHYGLFDSGTENIRKAVIDKRYEFIAFRSGTSGNPTEDQRLAIFVAAVQASPDYQLVTPPFPVRQYAQEQWYIYKLR